MQYSPNNVIQYNSGLGLVTRAFTSASNNIISTAEIDTTRSDILYGTFRMRAVVPTVPGVCLGFFSYRAHLRCLCIRVDSLNPITRTLDQNSDGSNVQEIDIEFLSSDPVYYDTIHYTNQPGTVGGNTDPNAAKVVTVSSDLTFVLFHYQSHLW